MWICVTCGEPNADTPDHCEVCGRVRDAPRWDNAPSFHSGPPTAPRNAPPAVAGRLWIPEPAAEPPPEPPERAVIWIPEAADPRPPAPEPASRSRRHLVPALPVAVLIVALGAAAVLGGPRLLGGAGTETDAAVTAPAGPFTPAEQSVVPGQPLLPGRPVLPGQAGPGQAGPGQAENAGALVTVDAGVSDDRAPRVAAMLETYFAGINAKDYQRVAGVLDPAGEIDPGNPQHMAAFSDGTATARDSRVVLRALSGDGDGRLRAYVSFRSEQEAGDGPDERLAETCTDWRVTYTVSTGETYRILRGQGVSTPC